MSEEMDRLVAEFEKFQTKLKQAEAQFAKVGDMQEELNALEAQVTSPDRSVTVVAGPSGSVKDLRLSPDAFRQQPDQLASTILATLHQAVAESARKQAGIVDEHVGTAFGLNVSEQVLEAQAAGMGTTVEELESNLPEAQPQRPAAPVRDEEDFANNNLLRAEQQPAQAAPPPPSASAGDQFLKNLFNDEEDHR
ncbi:MULTISPECIES: YbaB/EbfC family nucleoid-associated protein [unclassified Amycolatopsis]|uniref:YbaB/EbfC family nucleoid-associated protein n=1 Tax=unclassified Amycolatopsis TaxID=2618356 RepID=UPI001EE94761|nr:YbaB/EbfC family nucleoid-associated protein [Amycolatopsis sp. Poz14]MCG3757984.1 YbaB/EbfC family nucleoid-associated protein [Amycolatopsis sp. Poz14]